MTYVVGHEYIKPVMRQFYFWKMCIVIVRLCRTAGLSSSEHGKCNKIISYKFVKLPEHIKSSLLYVFAEKKYKELLLYFFFQQKRLHLCIQSL